jgi:hypothetical protein
MATIFAHPDFCKYCGVKAKNFVPPKINFAVTCSDKVAKDLAKDPLWQQKVVGGVKTFIDKTYKDGFAKTVELIDGQITECVQKAKKAATDKEAKEASDEADMLMDEVNGRLERLCNGLQAEAEREAVKCWAAVVKIKSDYSSYKLKAGVKLAFTGGELIVSIATTAASGSATFGAAAIIGLVGIAQKIASFGNQIYQLCLEVEDVLDKLDKSLTNMTKIYEKNHKVIAGAREVTSLVLNDFFDTPLMDSITACTERAEQAESKLKGVIVGSHKLSVALAKLIKEVEKAEKLAKKGIPDPAKQKKALVLLSRYNVDVQSRIEGIIKQSERADEATEKLDQLTPKLKALQAKDSKAVKVIAKITSLGIGYGMAIASADKVIEGIVDQTKDLGKEFVKNEIIESL